MDLNHRLAMSYYKTIATINEPHRIFLVRHQETGKIYVKKILDTYNMDVYEHLYNHHLVGTPKIIDYMEADGKLIVIEEYISGTSLSEKIEKKELTPHEIQDYMLDLCNILEGLHSQTPAIVHRDIKPSNVMITHYNRVILLDFNASKYYSPQSAEDTVLLGTEGYAAPEQYGFGSSSPQTDIYALGILLKEMAASIDFSSPKIDAIIQKCTKLNPEDRFINIKMLSSEISQWTNEASAFQSSYDTASILPPGYRSRTPWKILTATVTYLFITWLCLSLDIVGASGWVLWCERILVYAAMLFVIFSCFNYMDIQRIIPLCQNPKPLIRYAGIVILNASIIFSILILITILETHFVSR